MYILLGISLFLAFFFVINLLTAALSAAVWRLISPYSHKWSAKKTARLSFVLRIAPAIVAFVFVAAFLLPAYLLFEPYSPKEVVSVKIAIPALFSVLGIGIALFRVFSAWRKTRMLTANWLENSEEIFIDTISIPVFCIKHPFPVIAVVGAFRPRMFVARQVFDTLSDEEFQASIAHEYGHLAARDNFKRILIRACRDLLLVPCGRELDRIWAETSEAAADEYAAHSGKNSATALSLASALVKVARIVPAGTKPAMTVGAFLIEEQTGDITWRVRRLLQFTRDKNSQSAKNRLGSGFVFRLFQITLLFTLLYLATSRRFLQNIHYGYEYVVLALQ